MHTLLELYSLHEFKRFLIIDKETKVTFHSFTSENNEEANEAFMKKIAFLRHHILDSQQCKKVYVTNSQDLESVL